MNSIVFAGNIGKANHQLTVVINRNIAILQATVTLNYRATRNRNIQQKLRFAALQLYANITLGVLHLVRLHCSKQLAIKRHFERKMTVCH